MELVITNVWALIGAGAAGLLTTYLRPSFSGKAALFLMPAYLVRFRITGLLPTNLFEVWMVAFVVVLTIRALGGKQSVTLPSRRIILGGALLIVGSVLSSGMAIMRGVLSAQDILGALSGFILVPIVLAFVLTATRHAGGGEQLFTAYIFSAATVSITALVLGVFWPEAITFDGRLRGFSLSPNHLAMYVMPALLLLIAKKKMRQKMFLATGLAIGATLLWTQSAGAMLGLIGGLVLWGLLQRGVRNDMLRFVPLSLLVFGLLFAIAAGSLADAYWKNETRNSFASRTMIWRSGTEMLKDNAALGIGPGTFQEHYLDRQEQFPAYLEWAVPTPHNAAMALWLSTGALGLLGMSILLSRPRGEKVSQTVIAASVALAAILVHGFVDTPLLKNDLSTLLFLLVLVED